jgi:hypothetical protein
MEHIIVLKLKQINKMALKITTQIGTDKGITSEAYVRISNYQISKLGVANFIIELFQNQSDSIIDNSKYILAQQAQNQSIGNNLFVQLVKEETNEVAGLPVVTKVPDLSSAQGVDIFTFGYTHLKAKLVDLFGAQNVVDC